MPQEEGLAALLVAFVYVKVVFPKKWIDRVVEVIWRIGAAAAFAVVDSKVVREQRWITAVPLIKSALAFPSTVISHRSSSTAPMPIWMTGDVFAAAVDPISQLEKYVRASEAPPAVWT